MKIKTLWIVLAAVVVLLLIFGGCTVGKYNTIVADSNGVENAWGKVQTAYQRRADLVPNLVSTVKGAAAHEANTLQAVTDARAKVGTVNITADQLTEENLKKFQQAQNELSGALKSLLAVSEAYPNIKGTENFRDLQTQLEGTENRISTARVDYTNAVNKYNNSVMKFPGNIIAGMFGFEKKAYFEAEEGSEKAPKVEGRSMTMFLTEKR